MIQDKKLDPAVAEAIAKGVQATVKEDYLYAFTIFSELYKEGFETGTMEALSFYALTVALVKNRFKDAIDLGRKAVKVQPFNAYHYVNLAKIYVAAGNRKMAVDLLAKGLSLLPENKTILSYWKVIGIRARPVIPFLSRDNPLNVTLGQKRQAKRSKAKELKRREATKPKK